MYQWTIRRHVLAVGVSVLIASQGTIPRNSLALADRQMPRPLSHPAPTISLNRSVASSGDTVLVQGTAPAGFNAIRVAWWIGEATRTATVLTVDAIGRYAASLVVPSDAPSGGAQICAAVSSTGPDMELAEFACQPIEITAPSPGAVSGQIPVAANAVGAEASIPANVNAIVADAVLIGSDGGVAAQTAIQPDGQFRFAAVPPGTYQLDVSGNLPVLIQPSSVTVTPKGNFAVTPKPLEAAACSVLPAAAVTDLLVTPGAKTGLSQPGAPRTYGTYLSLTSLGTPTLVTLQALTQVATGHAIARVEFWLRRPDGFLLKIGQDNTAPYQATYNASLLMPGQTKVSANVVLAASTACTHSHNAFLNALANPFVSAKLRNASIVWNALQTHYEFVGDAPNLPGGLPARYPDPAPSVPLLGKVENLLDTFTHFEGTLRLNRQLTLHLLQYSATAKVLGVSLLSNKTETWWHSPHAIGAIGGAWPPKVHFGPSTLLQVSKTFPVYSGPIWSFAGIVSVNASIKIGFDGSVTLMGWLDPWTPNTYARISPAVMPYVPLSLWIDILFGIGKVGVTATTLVKFELPLEIATSHATPVTFDDPCVHLKIWLDVWAEIYYFFGTKRWDLFGINLVNKTWGACAAVLGTAFEPLQNDQSEASAAELRTLPAPAVASDARGHSIMLYVEDTTPTESSTTPRVMARFWQSESGTWGSPMPISTAGAFVKDPAITFVGTSGEALAVWSQNTLSRSAGAALGEDISAIYAHQEIYFARWTGAAWTAPQALTDNTLGDGAPAIAGDHNGGATLAWVADSDGNLLTRGDLDILTREWSAGAWSATSIFDSPALDAQVTVIRPNTRALTGVLAWTQDADADLRTNGDRTIVVARLSNGAWETETTSAPAGADSPALAWTHESGRLDLAFVMRNMDEDGVTNTGVGNTGVVGTAFWDTVSGWTAAALLGAAGQPVHGEHPILLNSVAGRTALLFRRFDSPGTAGESGVLCLAQSAAGGRGVYGEPRNLSAGGMNWMQAATVDDGGRVIAVSLSRLAASAVDGASQTPLADAIGANQSITRASLALAGTGERLETLVIPEAADPALDSSMIVAPPHAAPGTTQYVTITVRNLGRSDVGGATVTLFEGAPGGGSAIDVVAVPGPIAYNDALDISFGITATSGARPLHAQLTTDGPDLNPANNLAAADGNALPAPRHINAQPSPQAPGEVLVSWIESDAPGILGYRILRSNSPSGPFHLVGLSRGQIFEDRLLAQGRAYYYAVQAYDSSGLWSPRSSYATINLPAWRTYLPIIRVTTATTSQALDVS